MTDTQMTNYLPPFPETPKEKLFAPPLMFCDDWGKYNGRLFWGLLPEEIEDKIIEFLKAMLRNDIKEDLFGRLLLHPSAYEYRGHKGLEYRRKKQYIEDELAKNKKRLDNVFHKTIGDRPCIMTSCNGYHWGRSGRYWTEKIGGCEVETEICYNEHSWNYTVWDNSRQWNDGDISGGYRCKWEPKKLTEWQQNHIMERVRVMRDNWASNSKQWTFTWKGTKNQQRYSQTYYSKEVGMINWRHSKKHLIEQIKNRGYPTRGLSKYSKHELARFLMTNE